MNGLLSISRFIDKLNEQVGKSIIWLVLIAVLISSINAIIRKMFNVSSNAFLELQWYLFSGIFLLGSGYALQKNEHVRIDVITARFSTQTRIWIELFGTVFFLLPMAVAIVYYSWPVFVLSLTTHEMSANAGGLLLWPARLLVPVGILLLVLQGLSQAIKCVGFLRGKAPDPTLKEQRPTAEEELAEAIRLARAAEGKNSVGGSAK